MTDNMQKNGKIGVFDSGLGGLFIARAIRRHLPNYDYVYLGDNLNVPYGSKSTEMIYKLTESAMRVLFEDYDCQLIIIACNTASVVALRRLQNEFLPQHFPDRRILGVVVPTLEAATELNATQIGLIATEYTVRSGIYEEEIQKINRAAHIYGKATPLLVPLIEYGGEKYLELVLKDYMEPMLEGRHLDSLILGCTHYVCIKDQVRELTRHRTRILSQDEIIPPKLRTYLNNHPEMEERLSHDGNITLCASDISQGFKGNVHKILGMDCNIEKVALHT